MQWPCGYERTRPAHGASADNHPTLSAKGNSNMRFRPLAAFLTASILSFGIYPRVFAQAEQARQSLPLEQMRALAAVFDLLDRNLLPEVSREALMLGGIRGMAAAADPDRGFYATESESVEAAQRGAEEDRLGLLTIVRDQVLLVTGTIEGSPSDIAGLRPRDVILQINDTPVARSSPHAAQALFAGPPGEKVRLIVSRGRPAIPLLIEVERRDAIVPRVTIARPADNVALVRIPRSFHHQHLVEVATLLTKEWQQRPYKGLIIDLRRNTGGVLETAVGMAAMFLPTKTTVATALYRSEARPLLAEKDSYLKAGERDPIESMPAKARQTPLVVLIDPSTSSGAEIIAAALRDHRRATLVGENTFGDASIQMDVPLRGASGNLRFTVARWMPPAGGSVDRTGVTPHVRMEAGTSQQLIDRALEVLAVAGAR